VNFNEELKTNWKLKSEEELRTRFRNYKQAHSSFWWHQYGNMYIFNDFKALTPP